MKLSTNFTLEELTATTSQHINVPSETVVTKLTVLVNQLLQPLSDKYGKPIHINSGYRSLVVNQEQGGSIIPLSQHCKGEAADLDTEDNAMLFHIIRFCFDFDQLIWEGGNDLQPEWVHVSYKAKGNRKMALRAVFVKGKKRYNRV